MRRTELALLLMLAACQRPPAEQDRSGADVPAPEAPLSQLERAAIETGVVTDVSKVPAIGYYARNHEAGRDQLCVVPGRDGTMRFGLEAVFGEEPSCRGHGVARRAGDKLILSFRGGDRCIIVARYDGDQVALPGVVDMACADLCEGRGTLEGVSYPRVANDARDALRARDRDGEALCPDQ